MDRRGRDVHVARPVDGALLRPPRDGLHRRLGRRRARARADRDAARRGELRPLGRRRRSSVAVVGAVVRALSERSTASSRASSPRPAPTRSPACSTAAGSRSASSPRSRARRATTSLAVVAFDLDHFKRVNDEQGHEAGDRALAMVGAVIADHVRGADAAARWGGEEFVVVLPGAGARRRVRVRRARPRRGRGIVGRAADRQRGRRRPGRPDGPAGPARGRRHGAVRGQAGRARPHGRRPRRRRRLSRRRGLQARRVADRVARRSSARRAASASRDSDRPVVS